MSLRSCLSPFRGQAKNASIFIRFSSKITRDPMTGELTSLPDIDPSQLKYEKHPSPGTPPPSSKLVFGRTFTDHMLTIPWTAQNGWGAPKIGPHQNLSLAPAASVLHYCFTLFEGMKAYRSEDGTVRLFRPDMNMARMNRSAERITLPTFDGEALTELIKKLVVTDSHWIPTEPGHSLYIRPTLIGTQNALGVGAPSEALLFVICSPVGPYYATGFKPVALLATHKYVRAAPGGTGSFKLGANYVTAIKPQVEAAAEGYSQNLWLIGEEHWLTEVGTMNLFLGITGDDGVLEIVTPPLEDVILPGVTRDSILTILKEHESGTLKLEGVPDKIRVTERPINMAELESAAQSGKLTEVFGAGTAAIVSSVDRIGYNGRDIAVPTGPSGLGPVAQAVMERIVGIQMGNIESAWSVIASK